MRSLLYQFEQYIKISRKSARNLATYPASRNRGAWLT